MSGDASAAIAGPGPCGWSQGCCTHLQAHWIAAPPPTAFRQRGQGGGKAVATLLRVKLTQTSVFSGGLVGLGKKGLHGQRKQQAAT